MSDIKDVITFVGSGLDSDTDIALLAKGDSRYRNNIVSGGDSNNGSLASIKGNEYKTRTWPDKVYTLIHEEDVYYHYYRIPLEDSFKGFNRYVLRIHTDHGDNTTTFVTTSFATQELAMNAFFSQLTGIYLLNVDLQFTEYHDYVQVRIDKYSSLHSVSFTGLTAQGTNTVINSCYNEESNSLIIFYINQYGQDTISEYFYNTGIFEDILYREDELNFSLAQKPDNPKVIGTGNDKLLVWTDNNAPRKLNIYKAKRYTAGDTTNGYERIDGNTLLVIKTPPYKQPTVAYASDINYTFNNLRGKTFKFAYKFKYDDNEYSVLSPSSVIDIPQLEELLSLQFTDTVSVNNRINISLPNSYHNVTYYILYVRLEDVGGGVPGNWFKYDEIEYSGVSISYAFYNDKQWQADASDYLSRPYDFVPQKAICQEVLNGNQMIYGGITEGYDNVDINVSLVSYKVEITEYRLGSDDSFMVNQGGFSLLTDFIIPYGNAELLGTPFSQMHIYPGEEVIYELSNVSYKCRYDEDTLANRIEILTVLRDRWNDTHDSPNSKAEFGSGFYGPALILGVEYATFTAIKKFNKYKTWKSNSNKYLGIVYYDKDGNRYGGVNFNNDSNIFIENLDTDYNNYVNIIKWSIYNQPPEYAYKYQWVVSDIRKKYTQRIISFNPLITNDYECAIKKTDLTFPINDDYEVGVGDRVVILGHLNDYQYIISNIRFSSILMDTPPTFTINREDELYWYINNINQDPSLLSVDRLGFASPDYYYWFAEIYRDKPILETDEIVYREFGECYDILDPGLSTRRHQKGITHPLITGGVVTDQTTNYVTPATGYFRGGDAYITVVGTQDTTSVNLTNTCFVCESDSLSYIYNSKSYDYGRPNVVDPNIKQKYMDIARWGSKFINGSQVNYINKFEYDNVVEFNANHGAISALRTMGYALKCLQARNNVTAYINARELSNADGSTSLVATDRVISQLRPSLELYGTKHPESVVIINRQMFFYDVETGSVIRDDPNGMDDITSEKYRVKTLFKAISALVLDDTTSTVRAGYDKENASYFISFSFADTSNNVTLGFDLSENRWKSYYDLLPTHYSRLGDYQFVCFNGERLYIQNSDNVPHCNFFGVQYYPQIDVISNANPIDNKIYKSLEVNSNVAWGMPDNGDVMTNYDDYVNLSVEYTTDSSSGHYTYYFSIPYNFANYKLFIIKIQRTSTLNTYTFSCKDKTFANMLTFLNSTFTSEGMTFTNYSPTNRCYADRLGGYLTSFDMYFVPTKDSQICSSRLKKTKFVRQEGVYRAAFDRDMGVYDDGGANTGLVNGRLLRGKDLTLKLHSDSISDAKILSVTVNADISK